LVHQGEFAGPDTYHPAVTPLAGLNQFAFDVNGVFLQGRFVVNFQIVVDYIFQIPKREVERRKLSAVYLAEVDVRKQRFQFVPDEFVTVKKHHGLVLEYSEGFDQQVSVVILVVVFLVITNMPVPTDIGGGTHGCLFVLFFSSRIQQIKINKNETAMCVDSV
jgi:hypothetical protein